MDAVVYDEIVRGVYRAAAGLGEWRLPLEAISREFGLWGSQIIGVDKRSYTLVFSYEAGGSPEAALDYVRDYHAINPRLLPVLQLKPGEWMHCHEHFDEQFVANSPFYQEFLIPYGGRYLSGTKLVENEHFLVLLGALRGQGSQPLNPAEIGDLNRIRGHMIESVQTYLHLYETYAQAGVGKQLLNELRYPALLIDSYRAIVYRNERAADLLATRGTLMGHGNQLRCRNPEDDGRLLESIRSLGLNTSPDNSSERRNRGFVRLAKDGDGSGLAIFLTAIRPDEVMRSFGHASLALLVLHEPSNERAFDPFIVAEIFGLTPAEAKVAVRIAQGHSIEQITQDFGIAVTTIRSQLKAVFAKTWTSRQSELAVLLSNLPDL